MLHPHSSGSLPPFLKMKFVSVPWNRLSSVVVSALSFFAGACVQGLGPSDATPVTAVIRLEENVDAASFEAPPGADVLYRFKYINAVSVRMPGTFAAKMSVDSNITYISQDNYKYPMAETVPWGIPAIQANDAGVPLPDASQPCFKVCVADSGFSLGHVDLVCTKPHRAPCPPFFLFLHQPRCNRFA
jgi:hypothetical protein